MTLTGGIVWPILYNLKKGGDEGTAKGYLSRCLVNCRDRGRTIRSMISSKVWPREIADTRLIY